MTLTTTISSAAAIPTVRQLPPPVIQQFIISAEPTAGAVHDAVKDSLVRFLAQPANRGRDWQDWPTLWNSFVNANNGAVVMQPAHRCRRCFGTRRDPRSGNARPCPACNGGRSMTVRLRHAPDPSR